MEEFINQLLGENTVHIWSAGIIWALMGILIVKTYYLLRKSWATPNFWLSKFSLITYMKNNGLDIIFGIIAGLVILRLGDYAFTILGKFGYDMGQTDDFVAAMIPVSGFVQVWLHKKRPKLSTNNNNT